MKLLLSSLITVLIFSSSCSAQRTYVGSTPAHQVVREFLGISLTDSIDFIRWKMEIDSKRFKLQCQYGIGKPGTPGFINEKRADFEGEFTKTKNVYYLLHKDKTLSLLEVNTNVLHLLDHNDDMLTGNGGYSYALNNTSPIQTDQFNIQPRQNASPYPLVFEGRTPCQELSALLNLNKSEACDKMKWYILFFIDSVTSQPSYFLKGGIGYRRETMERGKWQIITGKDGRIIYKLNPDSLHYSLYLLKGDDTILFFTGPDGRLLVGNENFSYTLNRRKEEHPPINR